jgi:hypothetical protein
MTPEPTTAEGLKRAEQYFLEMACGSRDGEDYMLAEVCHNAAKHLEAAEAENQELLERLKSLQYQTLGWAYADACQMADKGIDIRQVEVPIIIERMKRDFNMGKHNDQ